MKSTWKADMHLNGFENINDYILLFLSSSWAEKQQQWGLNRFIWIHEFLLKLRHSSLVW